MSRFDTAPNELQLSATIGDTEYDSKESWYSKALREVNLVNEGLAGGFFQGARNARDNPGAAFYQQLSAFGIGAALSAVSRRGGLAGLAINGASAAMTGAFLWDVASPERWSRVGEAIADTWQSKRNYNNHVEVLRESLGRLAFDTAFMTLGGVGGAKVGERLAVGWRQSGAHLFRPGQKQPSPIDLAFVERTNFTPVDAIGGAVAGIKNGGGADRIPMLANKERIAEVFELMMGTKAWNQGRLHYDAVVSLRDRTGKDAHAAVLKKGTGLLMVFDDAGFIKGKLGNDPSALAKYEKYDIAKRAVNNMRGTNWAYGDRMPLLSETLGKINGQLGLPTAKVIPDSDPTGWAQATYRLGTGQIRVDPRHLGTTDKPRLAEFLLHEDTHLEQDVLVIRRIAEKLGIKGKVTGKKLDELAAHYEASIGVTPSREFLANVVQPGKAQKLTGSEAERADRLIMSFKENVNQVPVHEARRSSYNDLKKADDELRSGTMTVKQFIEKEQETPAELQGAMERLLVSKLTPEQPWTVQDEKKYLLWALELIDFRKRAQLPRLMADEAVYSSWTHEREAYTVGTTIRQLMESKVAHEPRISSPEAVMKVKSAS